ncbi:MAG: hypothetical protein GWN84_20695 [Gammaproteobacteria bacterium]|nr:hypothetical protein [Gammaproteobacteria bacterium]NIR85180.1 hypothetical protein [Gammaproteobacteria bacterium]NIU06229.1 hypothetical protein [Gammaproteobacteria bacterium]NIX87502.1 hypothetical protein [Gammaproteobacteria bacterium]
MSNSPTDKDPVAEARALLEKATPGPWEISPMRADVRVCAMEGGRCICCLALMGNVDADGEWDEETLRQWRSDARLIAAAPTLLAALCDEVERLRGEVNAWARAWSLAQRCGVEFGPQTPSDVAVFLKEADRIDAEVRATLRQRAETAERELVRYYAGDNRITDRVLFMLRKQAEHWKGYRNEHVRGCGEDLARLLDGLDPKRKRHG